MPEQPDNGDPSRTTSTDSQGSSDGRERHSFSPDASLLIGTAIGTVAVGLGAGLVPLGGGIVQFAIIAATGVAAAVAIPLLHHYQHKKFVKRVKGWCYGTIVLALIAAVVIGTTTIPSNHNGETNTGQAPSRQIALNFTHTNFLLHPAGVAVDNNGTVYVADHDHHRVLKLAADSDTPTQMLQFTDLNWPSGVAVDTAGSVYVADSSNNRVLKLAAGSTTPTPLLTGLNRPLAVAVDASRNVYVADTDNRQVLELAADSTTPTKLPFTGLITPAGVAVDSAGTVYATDVDALRVYKLPLQAPRKQIELFGYAGLMGPKGVAVDSSLNVYVTDNSNRVLKLAADTTTPITLPFANLEGPTGVAVDNSTGNVYVADWGNGLLLKLPPK
jgi:serine/threonine protein kinase, bacterial